MLCIFCQNERESSIEHVFPDAIGGTLTIERVCKLCNDWLGANIDSYLTDHLGILMKRHLLQLPNRDGKTIRLDQILGQGTLASDPDQRVKIVQEPGTEKLSPKLLYKSERLKSEDGTENIRITIDASQADDIEKIITRVRNREGLPPLSPLALEAEVAAAKAKMGSVERPGVLHNLQVDIRDYQKAIFKIAYELAWLWLGDAYLNDPTAAKLRNKILQGGEEEIGGHIQIGDTPPFDTLWKDEPNAHIGFAMKAGPAISIAVRIFDVMSGIVVVTESPTLYPNFTNGMFFCCDAQSGDTRGTTLPEEMARLSGTSNPRSFL